MICDKEKCNGCFACNNICPKKAISMTEDNNGFIYPKIDTSKCINCNLCKKVCPSLNNPLFNKPDKCYAIQNKDPKELSKSSSGGAATLFVNYFLQKNWIVYSSVYESGFRINHIRIKDKNNMNNMRGSKYVHSYINNTYALAKKDLLNNKNVLFIGTPCQIAGLKSFLIKDYDNLYTIDLICHGVPSQSYLKDELTKKVSLKEIKDIKFRYNNTFAISINDGHLLSTLNDSLYYNAFMNGLIYRENCYSCIYAGPNRCSDITIGDFWGLHESSILYDKKDQGVSVVLINSTKGNELFDNIKNNSIYEERDISEAIQGNSQLRAPVKKPNNYDKFKRDYIKLGFEKSYKKNYYQYYLKNKIKNNSMIYKLYEEFRRKKYERK